MDAVIIAAYKDVNFILSCVYLCSKDSHSVCLFVFVCVDTKMRLCNPCSLFLQLISHKWKIIHPSQTIVTVKSCEKQAFHSLPKLSNLTILPIFDTSMFIPTKTVSTSGIFANSPWCKCSTEHFPLVKLSGVMPSLVFPSMGSQAATNYYIYSRSVNKCH